MFHDTFYAYSLSRVQVDLLRCERWYLGWQNFVEKYLFFRLIRRGFRESRNQKSEIVLVSSDETQVPSAPCTVISMGCLLGERKSDILAQRLEVEIRFAAERKTSVARGSGGPGRYRRDVATSNIEVAS